MLVLTLFALLASVLAAWNVWGRVRWFLHGSGHGSGTDAPASPSSHPLDQQWALGHASALGVLVGLALTSDRAPLATAIAACLAWTLVSASSAPWRAVASPLVFSASVRRQAAVALVLAAVPVAIGTVAATESAVVGGGAFALLAGWLVADVGAPLWVALAGLLLPSSRTPEPPPLPPVPSVEWIPHEPDMPPLNDDPPPAWP